MKQRHPASALSQRIGKKGAGSALIFLLVVLYALTQPWVNERFGWDLPGFDALDTRSAVAVGDDAPAATADEDSPSTAAEGFLREMAGNRYLSPAGLQYVPGSAEGHRLEHLRRHTSDQPTRPGKHGVFDGGMTGALQTIDRAYERAKKKQRTTKQVDQGRTIYTVDLGRRVGYVGGREGGRLGKPMARRVKIVLEGTRVITAYPL